MHQRSSFVWQERRKTHALSILARFLLGPSTSGTPRVLVPAIFPEYVDPGSVAGRYEKTGFFGSLFAADGCKDTSGGGPGKISVASVASPSKWGGCTTGTPGNINAGALAMEVMVSSLRGRDEEVGRRRGRKQRDAAKPKSISHRIVHSIYLRLHYMYSRKALFLPLYIQG